MIDIVALGEILIDFTSVGVNEQKITLFAQNPGGAPANVLAMNTALGGTSAFIGKVGRDGFGEYLRGVLKDRRIEAAGLVEDDNVPTTLAFVHLDESGERSFTFYRNPGADMMLRTDEVEKELVDKCRIFHFGSVSLTDEPCRSTALETAAYAKTQGKTVSFDPNYRPLLWRERENARQQIKRGIELTDILKVSYEEMTLITGKTELDAGAQALIDMGPSLVLVSLGADGAYYRNYACAGRLPAYDVKTIDTTGAGDAFVGAMLWQLKNLELSEIRSMEMNETVAFANAAGSLTTTRTGAIPALPTLEEIRVCCSMGKLLK